PDEAPQTDQNLAEMAQQLEAALRRAPSEGRAPVTDPLAVPSTPKPVEVPRRDYKLRVDPRSEAPAPDQSDDDNWPEPPFDTPRSARQEPRVDRPAPQQPRPAAPAGKSVYDSLEQEMASLLGRPPGKT